MLIRCLSVRKNDRFSDSHSLSREKQMKKRKIAFINFIWILILIVGIGTIGIFTAVQMGVFATEPEVEIKAKYATKDAPVLKVATDYDFCPNSYFNSKEELSGLYIEVINEAANRLGMAPEFITDDWQERRLR